jgi:chromosome segregation ATPase
LDVGPLLTYSRAGGVPRAVRDALAKAAQLRQDELETQRQIDDRNKQYAAMAQEQSRIRDNMKTVDAKSQYYKRLLDKLNEQESSIERLLQERSELAKKHDAQHKELEDYLSNLSVG